MRVVVSSLVWSLALVFLLAGLGTWDRAKAEPPISGDMIKYISLGDPVSVPETSFIGPDGQSIKLADFLGRIVLINFWATWCAPCIRELPEIDQLRIAIPGEDLEVMLISIDRGGAEVYQPFLEKIGVYNIKSGSDPRAKLLRAMRAPGIPFTALIDREGRMVGKLIGNARWGSAEAQALIKHYLEFGK